MKIASSGQALKALRILRKLTQAELADSICSVKQLQRIEKGDVSPSVSLQVIAKLPSKHR